MHPITAHTAASTHCADAALHACANAHPTLIGGFGVILFIVLAVAAFGAAACMSSPVDA